VLANLLEALVVLLIAVILLKLLQTRLGVKQLLSAAGDARVLPERVQLLVVALIGGAIYLYLAIGNLVQDNPVLPEVPYLLLWLLAGSQLLYVVGKTIRKQQRR